MILSYLQILINKSESGRAVLSIMEPLMGALKRLQQSTIIQSLSEGKNLEGRVTVLLEKVTCMQFLSFTYLSLSN